MKNILKKFMYVFLLILSPLATLVVAGVIYVFIYMKIGISPLAALNSFKALIYGFMPYFPYLTAIPAVLLLILIVSKNLVKIKK
ncbi:hypothetical protein [Clostridium omnivorum]|uniref:LptF/LptG family permease n=1 Tax=Clostridium omnivorum TaxID=1604902 RepID=A0ABQ5N2Z8_9CLOT|nr:hypothetical protein [Clostridium sp. E14]GLC29569.1 hypothetical protein bsdE14_09790 [Clostridium sp. E14]